MSVNKEKRELKTEPNLNITLDSDQKDFANMFYECGFNFLIGDHSTGKTQTAVYCALNAFRKKQFNKIWITRPILKNNLGILPAGIDEKLAPYIFPIMQCLDRCQSKETTAKMRASGSLEIMPVDVAKGVTFTDSVVIVDEFQDMVWEDFRTMITRVGEKSKIIFCGSKQQISRQIGKESCMHEIYKRSVERPKVGWVELKTNHRHPELEMVMKWLEG